MCSPQQTAYLQTGGKITKKVKKIIGNQEEIQFKLFNFNPEKDHTLIEFTHSLCP